MASTKFSYETNSILMGRSKSFNFSQWISFLLAMVVVILISFAIYKANESKVQQAWSNNTFGKTVAITFCIVLLSGLLILFIQTLKSTATHKISMIDDSLYIDKRFFCKIADTKSVVTIRNVGYKGLGVSYTLGIKGPRRRVLLIYYLDEKEIIVAEEVLKNYLEPKITL